MFTGLRQMNDLVSFISTIGFPIAMCLLLWYDKVTSIKENAKALNELSKAIEQNTLVTQSLYQSIVEREK